MIAKKSLTLFILPPPSQSLNYFYYLYQCILW